MPKYYCDYCDKYLTHDSPSVRKSHTVGKQHKLAVQLFYKQFEAEFTQSLIESRLKEYEESRGRNMGGVQHPGMVLGPYGNQMYQPQQQHNIPPHLQQQPQQHNMPPHFQQQHNNNNMPPHLQQQQQQGLIPPHLQQPLPPGMQMHKMPPQQFNNNNNSPNFQQQHHNQHNQHNNNQPSIPGL